MVYKVDESGYKKSGPIGYQVQGPESVVDSSGNDPDEGPIDPPQVGVEAASDLNQGLVVEDGRLDLLLVACKHQVSGCCTALEHEPHDQEVMGLNPAWCWAFFSVYPLKSVYQSRSFVFRFV